MNDDLRFVFDTNVFVSSIILPNSTAHSALAHAFRGGDADLLVLNPFRGIPILTLRAFLERTW